MCKEKHVDDYLNFYLFTIVDYSKLCIIYYIFLSDIFRNSKINLLINF